MHKIRSKLKISQKLLVLKYSYLIITTTTLEKIFWEKSALPSTSMLRKLQKWAVVAKIRLFDHCISGTELFWNSLNLSEILKYFFRHCLKFWSGLKASSDWNIKVSLTFFLFWKLLKQTFILICEASSAFYRLIFNLLLWLLFVFLPRIRLNNKQK